MIDWLTVNWHQLLWVIGSTWLFQVWRRSGHILDELRIQRAERIKGRPLTDEEIEYIEVRTDAWWGFEYQKPDDKKV